MSKLPTIGDELVTQVRKIATAMEELKEKGLPRDILILWIHKKTKLAHRDIIAVLDALASIRKEFEQPVTK